MGQLVSQLKYKLEKHNINLIITNESYTSKSSFIDNDILPDYKPQSNQSYTFSGSRIKRGLYQSKEDKYINSDVNGAYNIMRKVIPNFSYNKLIDGIVANNLCLHKLLVPLKFNATSSCQIS